MTTNWIPEATETVDALANTCLSTLSQLDAKFSKELSQGVPVYSGDELRATRGVDDDARELMSEMCTVLKSGPGVLCVKGAFDDLTIVKRATSVFEEIEQDEQSDRRGDHFGGYGENRRIWNALEKLALRSPAAFVDYYSNEAIAFVARAWLGPAYQVTSQVNLVMPGAKAQVLHCDYHLGFQSEMSCREFPLHVHQMSQFLTLQGAIAHCDMPLESGPTMFLPYSQKLDSAYVDCHSPEVNRFFDRHHVQLPLCKGDALFFNPRLMHCAGPNKSSNIMRRANLLQISSAFGRPMETVNHDCILRTIYPDLLQRYEKGSISTHQTNAVVAASADCYPFPVNLDRVPPGSEVAPSGQMDLILRALRAARSTTQFSEDLDDYARQRSL